MIAKTADLVIVNGDVRTMDPLTPYASAIAISAGRIEATGDDADIRQLAGRNTEVIDAGGRLVLPGFQDTHIHLQDSGTDRVHSADLEGAQTVEDLQQRLKRFMDQQGPDGWITGVGWYSGIFGEQNLNRFVLDEVSRDRPIFMAASDGHSAAINTKACEVLGITAASENPPNGIIVRQADGEPQGLIYEDAILWIRSKMPSLSDEDYVAGVRYGQDLCNRHGITGVLDAMVEERHMRVYRTLEDAGGLTVRVGATAKVEPRESVKGALDRLLHLRRTYNSPMVKMHSAKFFLDGVFENRTAAMMADYSDATGGNAPVMFEEQHLNEMFKAFDAARFQIHIHVIGDKAARAALDALELARKENGAWPSLHQLAHVQIVDPQDIPRFAQLGAVANIQPLWAGFDPSVADVALPMVGEARGRWMYPFKSLLAAGAMIAVSSDWGVSTLNPFPIMQTAVTRQPTLKGSNTPVFLAEECISVEDVVRGYTVNAAASAWRGDETGTLSFGKHGDVIILDRNIFAIDPKDIGGTQVLLTLLGGREVYRAKDFAG